MQTFTTLLSHISSFLWGYPMIIMLLGTHLFLTIRLKFPQRHISKAMKLSFQKDNDAAGAVINADAVIGKHCFVNTGATIDHDVVLEDFVHVAPGVNISGAMRVGEGTWVGVGSCAIQCLNIGRWSFIGAGSVVVKDIPDGVVAYGNPCRVVSTERMLILNTQCTEYL